LKRTATSTRDLERVEVMGRVAQEGLKLVDAAAMLQLSYRKVKRMWRRYQQVGRKGMQHAHAGRPSNPGVGEKGRSTAKRRERKEHFGELVQLDGLRSK